MSSDIDKFCRALFFSVLMAKSPEEMIMAIEAAIGADNASAVRDLIAQSQAQEKKN